MRHEAITTIGATPLRIWSILTDPRRYPAWDAGMIEATGTVSPGAKLAIATDVAPERWFGVEVLDSFPSSGWRGESGCRCGCSPTRGPSR